jgi:hypothetical protein
MEKHRQGNNVVYGAFGETQDEGKTAGFLTEGVRERVGGTALGLERHNYRYEGYL